MKVDKRQTLRRLGGFAVGAPLVTRRPQEGAPSARLAPVGELVNVPEFEAMAKLALSPDRFTTISGGHRTSFDRMTLRQRLMVYAMDLDLTTPLFAALDLGLDAPIRAAGSVTRIITAKSGCSTSAFG